jgi:hypothetical protein
MTGLPSGLASWGESVAALDVRLATALGPLLRTLDDMIGRVDVVGGDSGHPDGYDGSTNRGDLGRLLMEEWLLAHELPDEFVRRAAEKELTYLRPAHQLLAPRGRTIAVVDTGPEQLGVGRLVQLAALVVLHRRSRAGGTDLEVRLVPGTKRVQGELGEILSEWLRARTVAVPGDGDVQGALTNVDAADHVWLLAGPTARASWTGHRRTVSGHVTDWGPDGVSRVAVRVGDATQHLDVPDGPVAVAALRGDGLVRRAPETGLGRVATTGRGAAFSSAEHRLLWRGEEPGELYACLVGGNQASKVRRYGVGGRVVAAAPLGRRVVAAVTDGQALWVRVIGKKLSRVDRIQVRLRDVGLDEDLLGEMEGRPLDPLFLQGGNIVLHTPGGWFSLEGDRARPEGHLLAMAPGPALDVPVQAFSAQDDLWLGGTRWERQGSPAAGPLVVTGGQRPWCAWTMDSRVWRVVRGPDLVCEIAVEEGDRVAGLVVVDHQPALVVVSPSGRIVRQVGERHVKTWTRWAGPAHFSVHPTRPWLARTTPDRILVGDLQTGDTLLDLRIDA